MTKIVLLHNHYDQKHLDEVVNQMRRLGSPTIRAYDLGFDNLVQAIEGCHRLRAAEILGLTPHIEYVDPKTPIADLDLDYDGAAIELVEELGDWENYQIAIGDIND